MIQVNETKKKPRTTTRKQKYERTALVIGHKFNIDTFGMIEMVRLQKSQWTFETFNLVVISFAH